MNLMIELDVPRELPHFYSEIQPMSKVKSDIPIQLTNTTRVYNNTFKNAFDENKHWLEAPRKSLKCNMMIGTYIGLPFTKKDVAYQHSRC